MERSLFVPKGALFGDGSNNRAETATEARRVSLYVLQKSMHIIL